MTIGAKIKEYRSKKEWTQEQLAQKLNVSRSTVSSWEVERNYPDITTLIEISELFKVSIDTLLKDDDKMLKSIDFSKKQKNKFKIGVIVLSTISILLAVFIGLEIFRQPAISFKTEKISSSLEMAPYSRDEIKKISVKNNVVTITLQSSLNSPFYGYYADGGNGEASLNLYKTNTLSDDSPTFEGTIQVDLNFLPKIKKLTVFVKQ